MNPARRPLSFSSLDRVMPDVDRLLKGHKAVGGWSLGQILNHLSKSVIYSVEGYPIRIPAIVRWTVGPLIFRRVLKTGRMPEGVRVPSPLKPSNDLDARAEAEALRGALQYLSTYTDPLPRHPIAGNLSRADYERLIAIHCAHHLSFVLPVDPA